jgi:flagellar basal-body rod protein FlgF
MSGKGIYSALSGAMAQSQQLDTIANNIANASTPGFKGDKNTFKEYLTILERAPEVNTVPRIPASPESFFDMEGTDKSYAAVDGTYTDFTQGGVKATGNSLDLALEGKGFIEVLSPQGPRLTRKGTLTLNAEGVLVTTDGLPVLKKDTGGGGDPQERTIRLSSKGNISFTGQGGIYQDGANVGDISIVEFDNNTHLKKVGNALYANTDPTIPPVPVPSTLVHQGFIETSNVNIVKEMTDMIATTRNFESNQRVIKAYDEMDSRLVNDVPKLG